MVKNKDIFSVLHGNFENEKKNRLYLSVNLQSLSQHGPSLGEHSAKGFRLQRFSVAQAACSSGDNVVGPCLKNK